MEAIKIIYELDQAQEMKINQIHFMLQKLSENRPSPIAEKYITSAKLRKELNISARTEQNWKSKGIIRSIKIEGKLYYEIGEVENLFLEENE